MHSGKKHHTFLRNRSPVWPCPLVSSARHLFLLLALVLAMPLLQAQSGKDGPYTVASGTQIVNRYCPVAASITPGSSTLLVISNTLLGLCQGDLIMMYQAQGSTMNYTSNTSTYGDPSFVNSTCIYEFKYVQSVNGNVITVQTPFVNSFYLSGYPQVIRVPQYTTLTINPGPSLL